MVRISRNRIDLEDARVDNAVLKDYGETLVGGASGTNTGSSYEVDLSLGNVFNLVLNANCTFTFSNPHASGTHSSFTVLLKQDSAGSRTVTWPSSVKWQSGTAPTLSTASHAADVLGFTTNDGGTKWLGFVVAQNYDIAPMQFLWT